MKNKFVYLVAAWMFALLTLARSQSMPLEINYQGELLDNSGNPANGNVMMTLSLFDAFTGSSALYTETQTVTVNSGLFFVSIGSLTPIPEDIFDTPPVFLEIAIDGTPITPRRPLTSVAYAFSAGSDGIAVLTAQDGLDGVENANEITVNITADGVTSGKITDETVTGVDLGNNSVDRSEIAADAVSDFGIADKAVGSSELANFIDLGEAETADGQLRIFSGGEARFVGSDPAIELNPSNFLSVSIVTFNGNGDHVASLNASSEVITYGADELKQIRNVALVPHLGVIRIEPGDPIREGAVRVYGDQGLNQAGIEVYYIDDGAGGREFKATVYGDEKPFRMAHPYHDDQEIWYAAIEGPEAAAYIRGTGRLIDGQGFITFPEHFQIVVNPEGMTVRLTPLDAGSKGLAVTGKSSTGMEVQELRQGNGTYDFDWEVKSVRKGRENFRVLRKKPKSQRKQITLPDQKSSLSRHDEETKEEIP